MSSRPPLREDLTQWCAPPKAIALFKEDIEYQWQAGFCKVIPWEELKRL
jgi:hypothetical protein